MNELKKNEKDYWEKTKQMLGNNRKTFSPHWSYNILNDPKRLGFVLSRYKFAAKMICSCKNILEFGCSEGIGAPILAENALSYTGVDLDIEAIEYANKNITEAKYKFIQSDFLGNNYGKFDAIVSLDVIEHISKEKENIYFETIYKNTSENAICIIGTPNITSAQYASKASQIGHVNLYSHERLLAIMKKYFYNVFPFGINDEIVHTGFAAMSHYLIFVGCHKKENTNE
jgi:2-polyprenyl-3-methyl-5-hydroxy-6-metoxy-1,4-benzoquinol methylase